MKTANNCYQAKTAEIERKWHIIDATDQTLGRLAARVSNILMGKHKPTYTRHLDTGDFVIVVNAGKVKINGTHKKEQTVYQRYSGHPSGLKEIPMAEMLNRHPERVVWYAVKRMMPKSALSKNMLTKLRCFEGTEHPHQAQQPQPLDLKLSK